MELEPSADGDFATAEDHLRLYNLQTDLVVASAQVAVDDATKVLDAANKELRKAKKQLKTLENNTAASYGRQPKKCG